ncbi:hypothetical protein Tsubulata_039647 [Turnera subulata]|uniref:Ubiquitin-like domain-containing protein n=1 Tax=Turnera subulata TaxID=218843 RepID=A0A9Q0FV40_9ROSI|nr:hypothetical protein Tsubulata_039647 [Turnera subulata]
MGSAGTDKIPIVDESVAAEATIEIKIKTLDSQTYTMRVDKQMPVPALKEQIASLTGVLSEQQRLICRGKVLKDDQLLSAYHVEDGHTLHLVVRQPVPPSSEGFPSYPATDPASGASHGHSSHGSPGVVIETFSVPDQGDVPPEISRIVSAVLGSLGFSNIGTGSDGIEVSRERGQQRMSAAGGIVDAETLQPEQAGMRSHSDRSQSAFGLPTGVSMGSPHPPVIPDSLTTLTQYLSQLKREFDAIGRTGENNAPADATERNEQRDSTSTSQQSTVQQRLPTPASLAEVMLSTRQFLVEQVAECLLQLAGQLESQAHITDPQVRSRYQSTASRAGLQLHNLGAFLLELGRATMTARLGQAPTEAVVNAGPAVFVNPSGPNPLMVQPLPFQTGSTFGTIPSGSMQSGTGLVSGIGGGFLPRRIDIQIRRGSSTVASNNTRDENVPTQQPSGQRNQTTGSGVENLVNQLASRISEGSSFPGESGVRMVPIRTTMVAAVPSAFSRLSSESSGNSIGLYYPVVGRFLSPGHVNGGRGSRASGEHQPSGNTPSANTAEQQSTAEPAGQRQNGSSPTSNSRQEPTVTRSININILSAGGTQNNQESERQGTGSVLQLLRALFPGGEIHVEDANSQGTPTSTVPENAGASTASVETESRATDEGIFLSNLLREILPLVSQNGGAETNSGEAHPIEQANGEGSTSQADNSNAGTSRSSSDTDPNPQSPKRRKIE